MILKVVPIIVMSVIAVFGCKTTTGSDGKTSSEDDFEGGEAAAVLATTPLEGAAAKALYLALKSEPEHLPVGGGVVFRKSAEITCSHTAVAAGSGPGQSKYDCLNLTHKRAKAVFDFLSVNGASTVASGLIVKKTQFVACTYSEVSGPQGPGGHSGQQTWYSCSPSQDDTQPAPQPISALDGSAAEALYLALDVEVIHIPVGGGIVFQKSAKVTCTHTAIAAGFGSGSHTYECLDLSQENARQVFGFLAANGASTTASGLVVSKTKIVECTFSKISGPQGPGGSHAAPSLEYSCSTR